MSKESELALIGRTIAGKFAIESHIGGGAMGSVYRARQVALEKTVAIKVMHRELTRDAMFAQRFLREAKAASRIDHPNSMRVVDFGEEPDGTLYMAMEFLDGRDLFTAIQEDWPLPAARVADLLMQACAALQVAHDMGVVHRDLKPENIMVLVGKDDEGQAKDIVKVCDFGIAKIIEKRADLTKSDGPRLTTAGLVVGTPEYMSPEQGRGEPLDARADIYSLGVILFQMLTGKVPFDAESALGIVLKHVTDAPPKPSAMNPFADKRLEAICLKCLSKAREERFQSAREMRAELRKVAESRPLDTPVPSSSVRLPDQPHSSSDQANAKTAVAIDGAAVRQASMGVVSKTVPLDWKPGGPVAAAPGSPPPPSAPRLERSPSKITPLGTGVEEPVVLPRMRMTGLVVSAALALLTIGSLLWYVRGRAASNAASASAAAAGGSAESAQVDAGARVEWPTSPDPAASASGGEGTTGGGAPGTIASGKARAGGGAATGKAGARAGAAGANGGAAGANAKGGPAPANAGGAAVPDPGAAGAGGAGGAPAGVAGPGGPAVAPGTDTSGSGGGAAAPAGSAGATGGGEGAAASSGGAWNPGSVQVKLGAVHVNANTTARAVRTQLSALEFTLCYEHAMVGAKTKPPVSRAVVHLETTDDLTVKKAIFDLVSGPRVPDAAAQCIINFMAGKNLRSRDVVPSGPATADVEISFFPE